MSFYKEILLFTKVDIACPRGSQLKSSLESSIYSIALFIPCYGLVTEVLLPCFGNVAPVLLSTKVTECQKFESCTERISLWPASKQKSAPIYCSTVRYNTLIAQTYIAWNECLFL